MIKHTYNQLMKEKSNIMALYEYLKTIKYFPCLLCRSDNFYFTGKPYAFQLNDKRIPIKAICHFCRNTEVYIEADVTDLHTINFSNSKSRLLINNNFFIEIMTEENIANLISLNPDIIIPIDPDDLTLERINKIIDNYEMLITFA